MSRVANIRLKGRYGTAGRFRISPRLSTVFLLLLAIHCSCVRAEAQVSKEYQIKAVLLFRLAQFVEWPTNRFSTPETPIIIGVLGRNPFGDALHLAVRGETAQERPIEILPLRPDEVNRARNCHVLFISKSEAARVKEITSALSGHSVLTVSDMDGFVVSGGGMVRFLTDQNKVTLRINVDTAKAERLVLNSRLLRMAEIVKSE